MNINKVILMGRLTADPELKTSANNVSIVQFTVAVNRRYVSKESNERQVDFIDCTAFNRNADFLSKYFRKGSSIIVFGNIQVDQWKDKEGHNRRTTRVIVDELQFGESKNRDSGSASAVAPAAGDREGFSNASNSDFFSDIKDVDGNDAELPF